MRDARVVDFVNTVCTLQYIKLDFEEFAASAISVYQKYGQLIPVAYLREGPMSKQKKVVKDHDDAKTIGWSISNILNKENPINFTLEKRDGLKCTKDTSGYLRRYNSLLMDGSLKDSVDLL